MKKIYFDYAATTPVDKNVAKKIIPFLEDSFGNPSSLHFFGEEALLALDKARETVADFLGCKEKEVFFTSSATESNNIAILGVAGKGDHIITTVFEHKAVLEPSKKSGAEVTYLPVYKEGVIKIEDVKKSIKENTKIISIGYANSEIGTIQPIEEIGELIKEENKNRKNKIIFHTDAVQATNYLPMKVDKLGVDILTISGHKIYGPKGASAIYIKEGVEISPLCYGASQEGGIKPGTENIFAIAGLGFALEEIKKNDNKKLKQLRDKIIENILEKIPNTTLNGDRENRLPNNINISFDGVEGESLMFSLDMEGIAVSTGSACASKSLTPSYVLMAIGASHERAHSSIRITIGRYTTEEEVDYFLEKIIPIIKKLRTISGR